MKKLELPEGKISPIFYGLAGDRILNKGKYKDKICWYKTGLFNTLLKLRPKICLEIGTNFGGTSKVFNEYFERYMPQGILISADIKIYSEWHISCLKWVKPVIVYPHKEGNIHGYETEKKDSDKIKNSVQSNIKILIKELDKLGHEKFDFCFIDGDHSKDSVIKDIKICRAVIHSPHFMLLDDTKEEGHEVCNFYEKEIKPFHNHYDFEDWPFLVGCGLIWDSLETNQFLLKIS